MIAGGQDGGAEPAGRLPLREQLALDLSMLAELHAHELGRDDIVGLWARCYDGLLVSPLRPEAVTRALDLVCRGLTELPTYLDAASLKALAASYDRVYRDHKGGLMSVAAAREDRRAIALRQRTSNAQWMRRYGFAPPSDTVCDQDSLAVQLRFAAHLLSSDPVAVPMATVNRYLHEHLLHWVGPFARRVEQSGEPQLYSGLAALTAALLEALMGLPGQPDGAAAMAGNSAVHVGRPRSGRVPPVLGGETGSRACTVPNEVPSHR